MNFAIIYSDKALVLCIVWYLVCCPLLENRIHDKKMQYN